MPGLIDRLMRRVQGVVGVGRTSSPVNDAGAVQTVQVQTKGGVPVDAVPVMNVFGLSTVAPAGSDVVFIAIAGDPSAMVAVATSHQGSRPKNVPAGGLILHDEQGGAGTGGAALSMPSDGTATLTAKTTFTLKIGSMTAVFSVAGLAITGGMITVDGNVVAGSGGADQVALLTHKHPTAASGAPSSPTPGT